MLCAVEMRATSRSRSAGCYRWMAAGETNAGDTSSRARVAAREIPACRTYRSMLAKAARIGASESRINPE